MANDKPRIFHSNRDMALSLIPLVLICVAFAAVASMCSIAPFGPKSGPIPDFDIDAALSADAAQYGFPIRNPRLPDGWQPNSGSHGTVTGNGGGEFSTVGYITPAGRYMQLTQSNATEEELVPHEVGDRSATGTEQVAGRTFVVYAEPGSEPVWVSNLGEVRVLLRGAGSHDEFTALATATSQASPLPN
ncbi:MAG: DUF4245 domain-containing protein [Aldersonia sp.]|nr:DUF4245 domain-containing protein [Aldersonia sp.]